MKAYIENAAMLQQMDVIEKIGDSKDKALAYKKVFGNCCENNENLTQ